MIKITDIKTNPNNPRLIKDEKFAKLVKSINEFPKMMELRPLVVNADNVILGGNMRFKALKELGYTNIPKEWVKRADELTEDETRRFIIADNVGFGEHDWDLLANDWDSQELEDWGLDVWQIESEPNYEDLVGEEKNKPPIIKITFKSIEQLQKAEIDIQELIDRKYEGSYFSVSAGEI